jgi:hypothetical protein
MILFAIILIATAVLVSAEYGWRGALLYTVAVGFLQDPIRKVAEGSTYYGGLAFACFLITFIALKSANRYWYATYLFWTNQKLITLLPIFYYLIGFQALNSFARIGDIRLSIIGMLFYTLPLLALWVGFHLGKNQRVFKSICNIVFSVRSKCIIRRSRGTKSSFQ